MQRLSPLDATFLHVEDDVSHMHVGSVGIFEGPAPASDDVLAAIAAKLHLAPRYRQKLRFVPLQAGRPVWVDDPHFDLAYHVRFTAVPAPGSDEQLRAVVGRVMARRLDRTRPLWEMWVVSGLSHDRWALISKLHHAMVDGISASNLITAIMDPRRDAPTEPPVPWTPEPCPPAPALVASALAERARWPVREARAAVNVVRAPGAFAGHAIRTVEGLAAYAGLVRPAAGTDLNGPIGAQRRWCWARARLAEVKEVRAAFGGTVNDVVLAAIAAGFRDLLLARGEDVEDVTLRTLVPVSVRVPGSHDVPDNRVSAIFAELPVAIADPLERLEAIERQMRRLKASHEAEAGEVLTALGGFAPEALLALGGRLATRLPQHNVATVTTNVPGPQVPLHLAGRRMLEAFPYVPLGGHVRIGVAIYSYDGGLAFGVTGDYDTAPDIDVLADGIARGMAELVAAARTGATRPQAVPVTRPRAAR